MILELVALVFAALPAAMTVVNLAALRTPGLGAESSAVSVLIPARDEADNIESCIRAALRSVDIDSEVIVLDDGSTDGTGDIVRAMAARDPRVTCALAPPLPQGWAGKQHACHVLATLATKPNLIFVDADVRLELEGSRRLVQALDTNDLVSGVPRQRIDTLPEQLFVPMINTLILGYLPVPLMRRRRDVGLAAGCGQLIAVRAASYRRSGGHEAIRSSLHDGLKLPRLFRAAGMSTDLVDGTSLACCHMYPGGKGLIAGLLKNATEGMARPVALPIWTVLLVGGHVVPWVLLVTDAVAHNYPAALVAAFACSLTAAARILQGRRCQEPARAMLMHPIAVASLVALQWIALVRSALRRPSTWRGRSYGVGGVPL
jgi:hypothetical protein